MNFLLNLFSCGSSHHNKQRKYVSSLCVDRNHKNLEQSQKGKDHDGSLMVRTLTNSSKPISSMSQIFTKRLPQTKYIVLKRCFSNKQRKIDWGDLVGVVNYNPNIIQITPNSTFKIKIGRNQQINCFETMRPYALDWLIVYWGELQGDYGVKHFIRCRQPIIFIVEDWETLLKLVQIYEEELLNILGDYCLLDSKNKIFFNIITYQNKYLIEFEKSQLVQQHVRQIFKKSFAALNFAEQDFNHLLEKMTLNDYIDLQRDPASMQRKIRHYLNEIERQKYQKQKGIIEPQLKKQPIYFDNLSEKEEKFNQRKQSKSSDVQLQAEYFASIRKKNPENQQKRNIGNQQDQILKIYDFNNGSDIQQSDEIETQQVSRPFNYFRKIRSKSEDANYIPENNVDLDDEFYQKYS